ncbi:MAG: hypothetical protein ACLUAR_20715 [Pilosibacter sp.]
MDRGGYVYPMSGQAQTVLDALLSGAKEEPALRSSPGARWKRREERVKALRS